MKKKLFVILTVMALMCVSIFMMSACVGEGNSVNPVKCTITFETNGGNEIAPIHGNMGNLIVLDVTTSKTGYNFAGWYIDSQLTKEFDIKHYPRESFTLYAKWSPKNDTKYKIEYLLENIENDEYTIVESIDLSGTSGVEVTAEIKEFAHFTFDEENSVVKGNIAGDGSFVLKAYYKRDIYTVTFDGNGGTLKSGEEIQKVKFGGSAVAPTYEKEGFTFSRYDKEFAEITEDIKVTANWINNDDTKYNVEYYLENVDNNEYTLYSKDLMAGTVNTEVTAEIKEFAHFTFNEADSIITGNINADESLVLKVYYKRDVYVVTFIGNGGTITDGTEIQQVKYQGNATAPTFARDSYTFVKFDGVFENVSENISISAIWKAKATEGLVFALTNGDTEYSVRDYTGKDVHIMIPAEYNGKPVTKIGIKAFFTKDIVSVNIPDSVTIIDEMAFSNCTELSSLVLGINVMEVRENAFDNCWRLASVYYKGSPAQWKTIKIINLWTGYYSASDLPVNVDENRPLTGAKRYYYSALTPTGDGNFWHYTYDDKNPVIWTDRDI